MISDPEIAERLATLDARDKILRQQMTKQTELSQARAYIGTCQDMCPERERCLRIGSSLSIFERDEQNQPNELSMVKEYRRAGADQEEPLPHDLRTPAALERTMNYLCYNIMDDPRSRTQELVLLWYDFLWDRLRAIRKDITQQNICDQASAILVERCTRFHIHSSYAMNSVKDFDVDMNKRNLNDCLQMLRQMYTDLRNIGIRCEGELEFQKYDILLHLEEDQLSSNVAMKTSEHRSTTDMKYVTQLFYAYTNNHYYNFFKLMEKADYMTSCILSLYVNKVRLNALKIIIASCTSKHPIMYPASLLIETLGFNDLNDLATFASHINVGLQEKKGKYFLVLSKDLINVIRQAGPNLPPLKSVRLVESKAINSSVGQLVHCQPVGELVAMDFQPEPQVFEHQAMDLQPEPHVYEHQAVDLRPEPQVFEYQAMDFQPEPQMFKHRPTEPTTLTSTSIPTSSSSTIATTTATTTAPETTFKETRQDVVIATTESNTELASSAIQVTKQTLLSIDTICHNSSKTSATTPTTTTIDSTSSAADIPVCRMRFRQAPRMHPFEPFQERIEKPKLKRKSFNDSIQSVRDELNDEMKVNEGLMKIVRMIS